MTNPKKTCLERVLPAWAIATGLLCAGYSWAHRSLESVPAELPLSAASERRLREHPPGETPVVLLIGDSGAASPEFRTNLRAMSRERADLAIHLGDVSYHGPSEYGRFLEAVRVLPFPLFTIPGDHDRDWEPSLSAYDRLLGGRNRVVDAGELRLVLLDSSAETLSEGAFAFLEAALTRAPQPRWTVVATHCPPYQPGLPFPSSLGSGHALRDASAARRLLDLCRERGVSLLAAGHVHAFHRDDESGVPLVVSGGGGRSVDAGEWYHYVRVTFSDPIRIEPVFTTPESGRDPFVRLGDSAVARLLRSGPWLMAVSVAALCLLFLIDRGRAAIRYRHLVAGIPLFIAIASTRWEWEDDAILWPLAVLLCVIGISMKAWAACSPRDADVSGGTPLPAGPLARVLRAPDLGSLFVIAGAVVASELAWLLPIALPWAILVYFFAARRREARPGLEAVDANGDEGEAAALAEASIPGSRTRARAAGRARHFARAALVQLRVLLVLVPFVMKELNVFDLWPH